MNLYRRRTFLASAGMLLVFALAFTAIHAQRRAAHKLRATALLEVTTDPAGVVSTRVIPITVLDERRFRDAGIYKATPRPMALGNGVVYEAQKTGKPVGYVTIVNGSNSGGWVALGKWQPAATAKKAEPAQPAAPADERPVLHRTDSQPPGPAATPTPAPEQPEATSSSSHEDTERPVLRRRAPEKPEPEPTAPAQPTATPEGTARRQSMPVVAAGTQEYVGVSDAESSETRSYEFPWKPGEEQQMQEKMRKLALAQLPRENAQLTPNSLQNVVMRSFDLDMSNEAVLVLSAEIPGSYLAAGKKEAPGKFVSRYVTVIARVDYEGVPRKLASSVTDSTRLDVAPRLELIDAVDVDGDGLAELLFREYSFDEKSFIIYGVGRTAVTKVFEGASVKLK
ncbi:MAG TPA: hypothetical protein VFR84_05070 [Candidatus Angelobacter sp.]|nr:hypothetical protein [Candidatus Angelobacter sp.]